MDNKIEKSNEQKEIDKVEDCKIDEVAKSILKKYKKAFLELAK